MAIVAFGLGLDTPNVRHVIHWGPPDLELYVQDEIMNLQLLLFIIQRITLLQEVIVQKKSKDIVKI